MAGIKEAMKRVMEHRNEGVAVAVGCLKDCACNENSECDHSDIRYMIVKLRKDGGLITVYDYGSEIRIKEDIQVQHDVILMINDNWCATWERANSWEMEEGHRIRQMCDAVREGEAKGKRQK